jgi:hypothetical protein
MHAITHNFKRFDATFYPDGEVLFEVTQPIGKFLSLTPEDADVFVNLVGICKPNKLVGKKKKPIVPVKTKDISRDVRKEINGWGSNVKTNDGVERYYYAFRDNARCSAESDKIGVNGRIA